MEYSAIFLIGFLSSFGHCIGMCGGFVTAYTLKMNDAQSATPSFFSTLMPHLSYNSGRILTYVFLGTLFGVVGETLRVVLGLQHFQASLQTFAGVVMILIALDMGGWLPKNLTARFPGYAQFKKTLSRLYHRLNRKNIFGLGVVMGFIPCGLVYAAGAKAASTGSWQSGALTMLFFGLGTVPALLAVGLSSNAIRLSFRRKLFKAATILVILFGVITTFRGVNNYLNLNSQAETVDNLNCLQPTIEGNLK